eukprot:gnl/TRDRNA2_/TRDRNA2_171166_c6_seq1.p1 gnl/TRDRNA2_/TRDRNA2_171166_c6~~gnl/TRDRNA2_/TRDRNA2_171166_c6_seq1.p1  ORF type:complete len:230 (+),score=47.62 gnl/TRDRNA2_/TRDRNA2_171166_c6_seq1:292-981(+)
MHDFNAQGLATLAWAFATLGHSDEKLFAAFARAAELQMHEFNAKSLASTAWAFATLGESDEKLFAALARAAEGRANELRPQELSQLHQWVLWHHELALSLPLPLALRKSCLAAFRASQGAPSQLQQKMVATLSELGVHVEEEHVTEEGYRIHACVLWNGEQVAVEVEGDCMPLYDSGRLHALGWQMVMVPYSQWGELKSSDAQRTYLIRTLEAQSPDVTSSATKRFRSR